MPDIKTDDGCIIHAEIEGPQNAPVLMLSNSLGTTLHMWDGQVAPFTRHFRLLRYDLRSQIVDARPRLVDLRLGLIALGDIIAVVKANQFGPGIDELVVGDRDIDDRGGNLGADLHGAAVDECIVSRFVITGMQPPADQQRCGNDPANDEQRHETAAPAQALSPRRRIARFVE